MSETVRITVRPPAKTVRGTMLRSPAAHPTFNKVATDGVSSKPTLDVPVIFVKDRRIVVEVYHCGDCSLGREVSISN